MIAGKHPKAESLCRFLNRVIAVILIVHDDALTMVSVVANEVDVEHSVLLCNKKGERLPLGEEVPHGVKKKTKSAAGSTRRTTKQEAEPVG